MRSAGIFLCVSAVLVSTVCAAGLEPIKVEEGTGKRGSHEVRITVPGRFRVVISDGAKERGAPEDSGITGYYDLRNDPDGKYNYAAPWSGLFSHKIGIDPRREGKTGAIMPAAGPVELVEANPLRAVVKHTWPARAYGVAKNPVNPDLSFEQVFVVTAPDRLYQTLTLVGTGEDVTLKHFQFMLHTSHARWSGGTSGKGGVYSLPAPWTFAQDETPGPKSCVLHAVKPEPYTHGDGKTTSTHKANFLMVMHKAEGGYGYRANRWIGFRTCLNVAGGGPVIRKGDRVARHAMLVVNHEIADLEKAKRYVEEYRNPGRPTCAKGSIVGDGFDEATGCYTLKAAADGVDVTLPVSCHWPMFEIAGWTGGKPPFVSAGGARKDALAGEFIAHVSDGTLLVQLASDVPNGTRVVIPNIIRTR